MSPPITAEMRERYLTDAEFYHRVNTVAGVFAQEHGLAAYRAVETAILACAEAELPL